MLHDVNWLGVLGAAVAAMAVGYVWYHPKVLGTKWASYTGKSLSELGSPGMGYVLTFVGAIVMAWVLDQVLKFSGADTVAGGLKIAGLMWLGFAATTGLANSVFAGKKNEQYLLEQAHHLVSMLVMSVVLVNWG